MRLTFNSMDFESSKQIVLHNLRGLIESDEGLNRTKTDLSRARGDSVSRQLLYLNCQSAPSDSGLTKPP